MTETRIGAFSFSRDRAWQDSMIVWCIAAGVAGVFTLLYGLARPYMHDDSVFLIFAEELAAGRNPYIFYDNKLPGTFVLYAAWLNVFGHGVYSGRVLAWLLMAGTAVLLAASFPRSFSSSARRWGGLLTFVLLWFCEGSLVMTEAGLALFLAAALYHLTRDVLSPQAALWSGILFALAATFKQVGYGLPVAWLAVAVIALVTRRVPSRQVLQASVVHIVAFGAMTAMVWGLYAAAGLADVLWERAFAELADYERRISLSSGLVLLFRTGWFVIPAVVLVVWRVVRGRFWSDPLLFQFCAFAAAGLSLAITKRFYAHYLLAAVPAYTVLLMYGWRWYMPDFTGRSLFRNPFALAGTGLLIIAFGAGAWIKRDSLARIAGLSERTDTHALAVGMARYIESPQDRALLIDAGPQGIKASAMYYYTGLRPAWPLLFFSNVPQEVTQAQVAQLPELMRDPHLKVMVYEPQRGFHPYWRPIDDAVRAEAAAILEADFRPAPELGSSSIWVRKEASPGAPNIYRGPYANRNLKGLPLN